MVENPLNHKMILKLLCNVVLTHISFCLLLVTAGQPHLYIRNHQFSCTYDTDITESAATSSLVETGGLRWGRTGCGGGQLLLLGKWSSSSGECRYTDEDDISIVKQV